MKLDKPGKLIDEAPYIAGIDFSAFQMRVPTARYHCGIRTPRTRASVDANVAVRRTLRRYSPGRRLDGIPPVRSVLYLGPWPRQRVRGFVNACRHRGNAFCEGKGHSARFVCPYHNWSYGLDGKLLAVPRPDFNGTLEELPPEVGAQSDRSACRHFAGFLFINPDRHALPLTEYLAMRSSCLHPTASKK